MISKMEYLKHQTYNCFDENIVSSICHFYKRDIGLYFLNDFGFQSKESQDAMNKFNISTSSGISDILLEQFLGIKLERVDLSGMSYASFREFLIDEIKEKGFLGVSLDAYNCPWNEKYYEIVHMRHYSMIVGVVEEKCVCMDMYFDVSQYVIRIEELYRITDSLIAVTINSEGTDYTMLRQLFTNATSNQKDNRREEIYRFAELVSGQDLEEMYRTTGGNISTNKMIFSLNSVYNARCNYRDSLIKYSNLLGVNEGVLEDLSLICENWGKAQSVCTMAVYRKSRKYLDSVNSILKKIADDEVRVIECICSN